MQPFLDDVARLPLWLVILGLTVLLAIGFYWLGQLGQHIRIPRPSTRVIHLLGWYALSALVAWCATTFIRAGILPVSEQPQSWGETHRLIFVAIMLYLPPFFSRYLGK